VFITDTDTAEIQQTNQICKCTPYCSDMLAFAKV